MVAVVVLLLGSGALMLVFGVGMAVLAVMERDAEAVGSLLFLLLLELYLALVVPGLWRGVRRARTLAMIGACIGLGGGLLVPILLSTRSAKEWFGIPLVSVVHFPQGAPRP